MKLTRTEEKLLRFLSDNAGRPVSRSEILATVWQLNPARVLTRTVDMHVAKLRAKLGDRDALVTVHRHGYMLVKPG
jgi:DNA-binding response OmpR family regulator